MSVKMFARAKNHADELPTQSHVEQSIVTVSLFKYLRTISCLGGIYRSANTGENMTRWDILKLVYVMFIQIVLMTNVVFFLIATYNYVMASRSVARLLSSFALIVLSLYVSFVYSILFSKSFQNVHVRFGKYEERYGFSAGFKKWIKKLRAIAIVLSLLTVLAAPLKYFMMQSYPEVMKDTFPSNTFDEPGKSVGIGITFLGYTVLEIHWQANYITVYLFSLFLWHEFNCVQTQFKELSIGHCEETESRFNALVIHHGQLTEVLEDVSNYVQHFMFSGLFLALPVACAYIYSIISSPHSSVQLAAYGCALGSAVLGLGLMLLSEALVSSKAHGSLQYVWRLDKEQFSGKGLQKMNLFVSRLAGDSIGYNIHSLLTINMPVLLGIAGTLATYIIVVVQFKPSDSSCQCNLFRNVTG